MDEKVDLVDIYQERDSYKKTSQQTQNLIREEMKENRLANSQLITHIPKKTKELMKE
jgi:hypothetical protein